MLYLWQANFVVLDVGLVTRGSCDLMTAPADCVEARTFDSLQKILWSILNAFLFRIRIVYS